MKINFRYQDGTRSTITLDDKLLDVWCLTHDDSDPRSMEDMVRDYIAEELKHMRDPSRTLVSMIEFQILEDIAEALKRG